MTNNKNSSLSTSQKKVEVNIYRDIGETAIYLTDCLSEVKKIHIC